MEATVAAAPRLKRLALGRRLVGSAVRKPALVYTLYWPGVPAGNRRHLVGQTVRVLGAADLQAVVVERLDCWRSQYFD